MMAITTATGTMTDGATTTDHERERGRGNVINASDGGYYGNGQVYNRVILDGYPSGNGYPSGGYGYPGRIRLSQRRLRLSQRRLRLSQRRLRLSRVRSMADRGGAQKRGLQLGFQDGSYMARRDMSQNKPFNPNPRNEYGNRTHGYNSSYGDKNYYRSEYSSGYAAGYQSNYRGAPAAGDSERPLSL